jgi:hypothetical protein
MVTKRTTNWESNAQCSQVLTTCSTAIYVSDKEWYNEDCSNTQQNCDNSICTDATYSGQVEKLPWNNDGAQKTEDTVYFDDGCKNLSYYKCSADANNGKYIGAYIGNKGDLYPWVIQSSGTQKVLLFCDGTKWLQLTKKSSDWADNATCTHGTTTTTGKQYVGGTCDATASQCELNIICDKGHDKQSEIELVEQTPLIPVDYTEGGDGYAWSDLSNRWYSSNFKEAGLTKANTWASRFAYGAVYGNASCQPVSVNIESFMYISRNRAAAQNGDMSEEDFEAGLSAISGAEKAGYITKVLRGYKEGTQTQADFYRAIWTMFGT